MMKRRMKVALALLLTTMAAQLAAYQLPPREELNPFWQTYFAEVDASVAENFWGNLSTFKKTKLFQDPYIAQLEEMGYVFDDGQEHPAPFYDSLTWVFRELQKHIDSGRLDEDSVLWPGKAFAIQSTEGHVEYVFVPFGAEVPQHATALNLLTPEVFVSMLSNGYFPIGNAEREHTNQTLAEHDLAHMAGFVSKPAYTKAVRQAFRIVGEKMRTNPRVYAALQEFDSAYSLRLYYMIEVFTEIPPASRDRLQELIEIPLDQAPDKAAIDAFLLAKAADPEGFYRYLANLYWNYHHLVNPLGGESRDVLNRKRKFQRDGSVGSFYDGVSKLSSKFARNSMYSLFLNARAMLENVRSNHPEFERSITAVHTPFIGALLGTSQLEVEDWVLAAVEEELDSSSKLYRYIHNSNLWDQNHLLYRAYCGAEFDEILD